MKTPMTARPLSVYLAGRVNGLKWKIVRPIPDHVAKFVASDGGSHSEHEWGLAMCSRYDIGGAEHKGLAYDNAIQPIRHADCLVAYLNDPNSFGSIAEIAMASALGKPCYVIIPEVLPDDELDPPFEDPFYDRYWFVCAFPGVQVKFARSITEARSLVWNLVYAQYHRRVISSPRWNHLRESALRRAGHRCLVCDAAGRLYAHHRTYERLGHERPDDVIVLCRSCYRKFHTDSAPAPSQERTAEPDAAPEIRPTSLRRFLNSQHL